MKQLIQRSFLSLLIAFAVFCSIGILLDYWRVRADKVAEQEAIWAKSKAETRESNHSIDWKSRKGVQLVKLCDESCNVYGIRHDTNWSPPLEYIRDTIRQFDSFEDLLAFLRSAPSDASFYMASTMTFDHSHYDTSGYLQIVDFSKDEKNRLLAHRK